MTRHLSLLTAAASAAIPLLLVACGGAQPIPDRETPPDVEPAVATEAPTSDDVTAPEEKKAEPQPTADDPFGEDTDEYSSGASNFKAPVKKEEVVATPAAPELLLGPPLVVGPMQMSDVSLAIKKRESAVKGCFSKRMKAGGPAGELFVSFKITATGGTEETKVAKSTLTDAKLDKCVLKVFEGIRFPARTNKGTVNVKYPISLTAP